MSVPFSIVDQSTDQLLHEVAESGYLNAAYANQFEFLEIVRQTTGEQASEEAYKKIKDAHNICRSFSLDIARKLESVKTGAGFNPQNGKLTSVGLFSGLTDTMPEYAQRIIIPEVANKKRQFYLTQLKYFCSKNRHLRYFVVNEGKRCSIDDLETRLNTLQRKCSKLRKEPWFEPFADVFFRSTEFTIKEEIDGEKSYHVHANLVWKPKSKLPEESFKFLVNKIEKYFGGISKDNGLIKNVNELCKYFFKGSDLAILSAEELFQLSEIMFRKRLIAPMSIMRDQVRYFRNHPEEKLQAPCPCNGNKWRVISNHNSFKQFDDDSKLERIFGDEEKESLGKPVDQILAIMSPQVKFTDVAEPIILVRGYSGSHGRLLENKRIEMAYNAGKACWEASQRLKLAFSEPQALNRARQEVFNCPKGSEKPERHELAGSFSGSNPPPQSGRKNKIRLDFGFRGDESYLRAQKKPDQHSPTGSFSGCAIPSTIK